MHLQHFFILAIAGVSFVVVGCLCYCWYSASGAYLFDLLSHRPIDATHDKRLFATPVGVWYHKTGAHKT